MPLGTDEADAPREDIEMCKTGNSHLPQLKAALGVRLLNRTP